MRAQDGQRPAAGRRRGLPARRFRNGAADIENEKSGKHPDHEHSAPTDDREQGRVDNRRNEITARIARLQKPGHEAARLGRNRLHGERSAHPPLATHGDTVEGAQHDQHSEIRREPGGKFEKRIEHYVDHQRRPTAVAIGSAPEQEGADRPHRQGQQDGNGDVANLGVEFSGNVFEHEDE